MSDTIDEYDVTDLSPIGGAPTDTWTDESGTPDISNLRVNFSDEEAAAKSLEPFAPGKYKVKVTNVKVKASKSEKNLGKPYYSLEYTVQDGQGPASGRKVFDNVMLFEGALYSLSQLMKALGYNVSSGGMQVPSGEALLGAEFVARIVITPARTVGGTTYDPRNEVKGYFPIGAGASGAKADDLAP